jgi:hypothetical protein
METRVDKIKTFNMIIEDFLKQTTPIVGTTYYFYFNKLIKANATLPINYASSHLLKYKDKILNKDVSYFSDKNNYSTQLNELESQYDNNDIMFEILRLKEIYYKLNESSRDNVWDILQALLQLTIEYNEFK